MNNLVVAAFLIAGAIVISGVVGMLGSRYTITNIPNTDDAWVLDRLTGSVNRCGQRKDDFLVYCYTIKPSGFI
jgi:hypothetical protein